ncbi:MAG: cytochrome oxidase subunit III [Rhodospirillaceae bacterium]|jgi:hypothetical protein|nr:cytochrome oxidase subunit III [Rhodospirillaceae bacterium]MBT5243137.1 cytochrome oxidase subunit III [Rhodospirillaceae bacterium]MBT5563362.1 cytochrome oxidase subunit III [Rhodospirillaceae bacterium]MBT6243676.1 cytochrome oxidase subunit III [Rhodospirillaceae bacterium]MBT7137023.1 cytochrome oxidase subunit III [Rhodospirillaceae bacterium]
MTPRNEWRYNFTGWLLFTVSALFFIWSALEAGDRVYIIASLFFLIACLVFLVPVWRLRPPRD